MANPLIPTRLFYITPLLPLLPFLPFLFAVTTPTAIAQFAGYPFGPDSYWPGLVGGSPYGAGSGSPWESGFGDGENYGGGSGSGRNGDRDGNGGYGYGGDGGRDGYGGDGYGRDGDGRDGDGYGNGYGGGDWPWNNDDRAQTSNKHAPPSDYGQYGSEPHKRPSSTSKRPSSTHQTRGDQPTSTTSVNVEDFVSNLLATFFTSRPTTASNAASTVSATPTPTA